MTDSNEKSNRELVLNLQQGDLESLGTLYDRHNRLVFRTALGITGDGEAAADLLQEVFLRMHRFAEKIDPQRPLEPWLYRVTTNLSCTWVKRQRWMRPIDDLTEWLVGDNKESPAAAAESSETWGQIKTAIAALPLPQRTVIVMYYVNDLSLQEISDVINVPVGTIKSRLHYGRQALKKQLSVQNGGLPEVRYEFT
jgi:RNA polymerase sigma-70 factor (ECF subfamily)